jgi:colicin import membrane protein
VNTEISIIENLNALDVFKSGGIKPVIDAIREKVSPEVYDLSNDKGRKSIASNAHWVSRSKVTLDNFGKDLADKLNAQLKPINAERKLGREMLDELRDEIRKPLTEWEAEQERIKAEEDAKIEAEKLAIQVEADHEIALMFNEKFDREAADELAEKVEAERLQKEATEKEQKERDELIAKRAAEQAKLEETARLKAIQADHEAKILAAEHAAKDAELRLYKQKQEAELREKQAAEQAEKNRLHSIELERQRVANEETEALKATIAREANKANQKKVNNEALSAFIAGGMDKIQAKMAVEFIAKKVITNVVINY